MNHDEVPPPRDDLVQAKFFVVELRVQALESLFAATSGARFRVSADNVGRSSIDFEQAVASAARQIASDGLSSRAEQFRTALEQ